jgi:glutathione synthase
MTQPAALAVIMDPIATINYKKDTTLGLLLAAARRGWRLWYLEQSDLYLRDGVAMARMRPLSVAADPQRWYTLGEAIEQPLATVPVILMRKDPPFDLEYVTTTWMLDLATQAGVWVINAAAGLRDTNEKLAITHFPDLTPPTLVSRDMARLRSFIHEQGETILKPLNGMGGSSIFKTSPHDANTSVILETLTQHGRQTVMAQRFLPEIAAGDKRILLLDGEPVAWALARIPASGELRGNLAAGGRGVGVALSERDRAICARIAPWLRQHGHIFVGIDVIGDWLTEINVTSPTCMRELDTLYNLDIGGDLLAIIERRLTNRCP